MNLSALIPLLACIGLVVLIVLVARQSIRARLNQLFIWFTLLVAIGSFSSFMVYANFPVVNAELWNRLVHIFVMCAPVAFFHFVHVFLGKREPQLWLVIGYGLCVVYAIAGGLGYTLEYAYWSEGVYNLKLGPAIYAMTPVTAVFGAAAIVNLVQGYRRTKDPFSRNRIVYPLAGFSIACVLGLTNFLPGWKWWPVDQAGNLINAAFLSYAVLRYKLIDVSSVMRKAYLYSVLTIFILFVFLCTALLLQVAFRGQAQYSFGASAVITALILAFTFQPFYRFTQRLVEKRYYREAYDYRQALLHASQRVSAMIDIDELSQWLVENLKETMKASKAGLFLLDPGTQRYVPRVLKGYNESLVHSIRFRSDNPVVKQLARENGCLTQEEIDRLPQLRSLWEAERGQLKQLEAAVIVPLKVKGYLIGMVVLGPKLSERVYTLDDLGLLLTVASQAAVAVENAQLFETSLMRAEKLKESEEKYRDLVSGINDAYVVLRGDRIAFANNRCAEIFGMPLEKIIGQHFLKFVAPESQELVTQLYERSTSGETDLGDNLYEVSVLAGDGRVTPLEAVFRGIMFEGKPAISAVMRDITERKKAEKELRKRKDELEQRTNQLLALQRVTASIQSSLELREVLQQVSEAVVVNLGYDHSFILVVDEKRAVHKGMVFFTKGGTGVASDMRHAVADIAQRWEFPAVRGHTRIIDEALDGKTTVAHSVHEIAEPLFAREQCDVLQELLGAKTIVSVPAFAKDRYVGSIMAFSERGEISEEELEPLKVLANQAGIAIEKATLYHHSEEKAQQMAVLREVSRIIGSSLDVRDVYHAFTAEIKKIIDFDRASIALVEGDKLTFFAVSSDVPTELGDGVTIPLKDSVTAWVVENKRTNIETDFVQGAQFPINGKHLESGLRSAIRVPIFSKGEVFGTFNLSSRHPNAYGEQEREILEQVAGQLGVAVENSRLFNKIREREMELSKAYEELKAAHDFMVQSERLRALGEMAGGVAHDFNNVLSIILGRAQLALEDAKDSKVRRALEIIEQTSLDAAKTVRRLQDFARVRVDRDLGVVDVNQVVHSTLQMVESRRLERQQTGNVVIDICAELGKVAPIEGNSAELNEALVNILFNAMDAMPQGGKITVKTGLKNNWVILSVSDTGVGIPDEMKGKIFDPFFTTKGREGLGMGLSVTYGIVRRHGGSINFESTAGKGTTFYIRLPVARNSQKKPLPAKTLSPIKAATILLIDDDPQVSEVLGLMLKQLGHQVTGFTSAGEALEAFRKGDYKLVITDLGMPEISGRDVAKAVKETKPETPVVLITGWGVQLDPAELKGAGVDGIIAKPFSKEAISAKLAEVLASADETRGLGREDW